MEVAAEESIRGNATAASSLLLPCLLHCLTDDDYYLSEEPESDASGCGWVVSLSFHHRVSKIFLWCSYNDCEKLPRPGVWF